MRQFPLALVIVAALAGSAGAQPLRVEAIDIGEPEANSAFGAAAINSHGVVVGTLARLDRTINRFAVYTWTRSGGFRLIVENAEARDINDKGVIVGNHFDAERTWPPRGFRWSPSNGFRDLGPMIPATINNRGEMVGSCLDRELPCLQSGSTIHYLPDGFAAFDINERGTAAGFYRVASGELRPAVWARRLGLRILDERTDTTAAYAINDSGIAAGEGPSAALWTPLGRVNAPQPDSNAYAISNRGWIVGEVSQRAALWLLGPRLVLLPPLAGLPAETRSWTTDVNDAGQIIGRNWVSNDDVRSVLWVVR
jgi:hypothetical protein